ncbi:MAG: bifunctional metallophosphatase/5'-nucleotidase, partial [Sphingomonadales bacterium]|nr:bifunctional metallophosphatase/5'-nucleotidase [Sphingomonadales bacterium]
MNRKLIVTSKSLRVALVCLTLFYVFVFSLNKSAPALASEHKAEVHIIYISNMPNAHGDSEMPSLAKVATFVKEEREKHPNLIFLHGGDSLAPSILSSLDRGAHIIDILNSLNPDLMSISKREFSFGEDALILRSQEAVFPFVSNNIRSFATGDPYPFFEESVMLEVNGLKVGIISSTSEAAATRYSAEETLFLDVIETTKRTATKLRGAGADVIISMYDDKKADLQSLLSEGYVDILFETSFYQDNILIPDTPNFLHHDLRTGYISRLDFVFDPDAQEKVTMVNFERIDVSNTENEPETETLINSYIEPLNLLLDMELGHFNTAFSYSRDEVRSRENAFANFLVDVMRHNTKTDIALLNSG